MDRDIFSPKSSASILIFPTILLAKKSGNKKQKKNVQKYPENVTIRSVFPPAQMPAPVALSTYPQSP